MFNVKLRLFKNQLLYIVKHRFAEEPWETSLITDHVKGELLQTGEGTIQDLHREVLIIYPCVKERRHSTHASSPKPEFCDVLPLS